MKFATLCLSLLLAPLVAADADPIPDNVEAAACGYPAIANAINGAPPAAGRCVGADYVNPLLQAPPACAECSTATFIEQTNIPLVPRVQQGPVPLLPVEIPSVGPFGGGGIHEDVATLTLSREIGNPENYCITIDPSDGPATTQCLDAGPAGPLAPVLGPIPLVGVDFPTVGPTPGVQPGGLGQTPPMTSPARSLDIRVSMSWVESRLNQRLSGALTIWDPVDMDDPAEVSWWSSNPSQTSVSIVVTPRQDGVAQPPVALVVPYAGQALAAEQKTADQLI